MLFQKPSLRTRVTFETGMAQLGGHAIYLTNDVVLGARESVRDVAHNLERFVDGIVVRTGPHEVVVELAAQAAIPVINGLTLREHPVPGAGRPVHDRGAARAAPRASCSPSSATATTSTTRSRCSARRWGWRSASPIQPGYAPERADRRPGAPSWPRPAAAPRLRVGPARGRPRRGHRLHGRLDVDGPGGRDRGAARRLPRLPGRRRPARRGRARASWRCTACPRTAARRSRPR